MNSLKEILPFPMANSKINKIISAGSIFERLHSQTSLITFLKIHT